MLGHGKKTTNIAKALWLAMAIKTSLWLQILISEKKYLRHSFCYIDLLPGKWACKDDNDHSSMPGRVAMTGDLFLSSIVDRFHILCPPFTSFSYQVHSRHPENGGIKVSRSKSRGEEIYHICFEYFTPNYFVDLGKNKQKNAFHPSPIVCRSHIISAVKQLLNNL